MILLVIPIFEGDKDAAIEGPRNYADRSPSKLGRNLVVTSRRDATFWTVVIICRDRWMMRGLFSQERDCDWSLAVSGGEGIGGGLWRGF